MHRAGRVLLVAGICAVQWWAPAAMIMNHERTLREGAAFRFAVAPVDPYDAFRGRYVAIRFADLRFPQPQGAPFQRGQRAFASIEVGQDGLARLAALTRTAPSRGPYLRVRVAYGGDEATLQPPFDRFYLDEHLAPAAEQAYRAHASATNRAAVAVLRVRGDRAVLEDLLVGGVSIRQAAQAQVAHDNNTAP